MENIPVTPIHVGEINCCDILTKEEMEQLLDTDLLTQMSRSALLDSCSAISPDQRCRTLTDGLPVPLEWLAEQSGLKETEILAFHQGQELTEEKKCWLFAAKLFALRYFRWQVFPRIRQIYNLKQDELWAFLKENPQIIENTSLPSKIPSPKELLESDTTFFCHATGLSQNTLEKIAALQPTNAKEKQYSLLVTAAIWRNILNPPQP